MINLQSKRSAARNITTLKKQMKQLITQQWQNNINTQTESVEVTYLDALQNNNTERIAIVKPYIYHKTPFSEIQLRAKLITFAPQLATELISQEIFLKSLLKKLPKGKFVTAEDYEKIKEIKDYNAKIEKQIAQLEVHLAKL